METTIKFSLESLVVGYNYTERDKQVESDECIEIEKKEPAAEDLELADKMIDYFRRLEE